MKTTTRFSTRTLGVLVAVSSLIVLATADKANAQTSSSSDRMVILNPAGGVLFDNSVPEVPPTAAESEITFTGGPVNIVPPPVALVGVIGLPGTSELLLTEPAGTPPDPGEVPIIFSGPNGPVQVSDLVVSTLGNQATLPPFITLASDGSTELTQDLVNKLSPLTPFLDETGALQDITALLPPANFPGIGPITILVQSDVVPEPSTLVLLALGGVIALAAKRR